MCVAWASFAWRKTRISTRIQSETEHDDKIGGANNFSSFGHIVIGDSFGVGVDIHPIPPEKPRHRYSEFVGQA